MTYRLNEKIKDLKPYDPITGDYRIRLDANESFLPIPNSIASKILEAAAFTEYNRYPDPTAAELCEKFASYHNIDAKTVTAGNGSDELISVICSAFLMKGDTMMTVSPDFSMYRFYASLAEANCVEYKKEPGLTINVSKLISSANQNNVKLIIFSNPCNPTSLGLKREDVRRLIRSVNALVVVDEAYMDFWSQSLLHEFEEYDNLIILRTCSKAFAMAGIRLGFAVANTKLANVMRAVKSPYNVNSLTQKIGSIILGETKWIQDGIDQIKASRDDLYLKMKQLEAEVGNRMFVYPTVTNFVLVQLEDAQEVYQSLLRAGIAIRYMGDFLRITAGSKNENAELIAALRTAVL